MSQEKRFAATLGGVTAVAAAGLLFWGFSSRSAYSKAKEDYDSAADSVSKMEESKIYPSSSNVTAKKTAVADYQDGIEKMQKSFDAYRVTDLKNVDPAAFVERLKTVQGETAQALSAAGVEFDASKFYMGFEKYTTSTVKGGATGILGFEMDATAELFRELAAAKPSKILNVHRDELEEEGTGTFDPKDKTFRALPIEITFEGKESSLRAFLSSLDDSKKYYYVIRTMKVQNTNPVAPTSSAADFKTEEAAPSSDTSGGGGDGGLVLPPDSSSTPAPAAAPTGDTGKILLEVLGTEKVRVFLRIEILQFLGARELPKS